MPIRREYGPSPALLGPTAYGAGYGQGMFTARQRRDQIRQAEQQRELQRYLAELQQRGAMERTRLSTEAAMDRMLTGAEQQRLGAREAFERGAPMPGTEDWLRQQAPLQAGEQRWQQRQEFMAPMPGEDMWKRLLALPKAMRDQELMAHLTQLSAEQQLRAAAIMDNPDIREEDKYGLLLQQYGARQYTPPAQAPPLPDGFREPWPGFRIGPDGAKYAENQHGAWTKIADATSGPPSVTEVDIPGGGKGILVPKGYKYEALPSPTQVYNERAEAKRAYRLEWAKILKEGFIGQPPGEGETRSGYDRLNTALDQVVHDAFLPPPLPVAPEAGPVPTQEVPAAGVGLWGLGGTEAALPAREELDPLAILKQMARGEVGTEADRIDAQAELTRRGETW